MLIQTVSALNYLPLAAVMIKSHRRHHNGHDYSILVTDLKQGSLGSLKKIFPDVELLSCDELQGVDMGKLREMYSVLEFNSVCKILAISHQLRERGRDACLFLDPDMMLLGNTDEVLANPAADILITPHASTPFPQDGAVPCDAELNQAGHINGGIVFWRKSTASQKALDWILGHTRYNWFVSPAHGLYADQPWLSALPYFFRPITNVCSDARINIAYWNLHERELKWTSEGYRVGNEKALLFHFSGVPFPASGKLTKNSNRRFSRQVEADVLKLLAEYEGLIEKEKARLSGLESDYKFTSQSLALRIRRAENIWKITFPVYDTRASFNGEAPSIPVRVARKLKKMLGSRLSR